MHPAKALRAIAFHLERAGEPTYRVAAFRRAAAVVENLEEGELESRVRRGTLTELKGIGNTTAEVIIEAVRGQELTYLNRLIERGVPELTTGRTLRAALRGDCHTHSDWSDGGSPILEMAEAARALGHEWIALTDHSPRLTVARGLSPDRLRAQLDVVEELNAELAPFRILTGIEVDILDDGSLDQTDEMLAKLQLRVASVHSKLKMEKEQMTKRMVTAVSTTRMNVLGHCTGRLVTGDRGTRPGSQFDARKVFEACAEHEVAVEINSRPERRDPPTKLLELARDAGCLFSIDSDAHAPGQLDFLVLGCERAEMAGIEEERIINTWPRDRLLAWANR